MSGDDSNAIPSAVEEGTPLLPPRKKKLEKADSAAVGSSTVSATVFNFTNSIVGAGCIALGSAIGKSGGLVSIVAILFFAALSKYSFDLVIRLSREAAAANSAAASASASDAEAPASFIHDAAHATTASYESLGHHAYGHRGRIVVHASKLVYSYGSLVVYIKIVKDNFASAVVQLYSMSMARLPSSSLFVWDDRREDLVTILVGLVVIFPICLLRSMSSLEKWSMLKVAIIFSMLFTMIYLLIKSDYSEGMTITTYEKWFEVRPGFVTSLGSFVFTFVAQHTINITYESMKPELQTMANWEIVSTASTVLSAVISMAIGLVVYVTFWTDASSNVFSLYPAPSVSVALAKFLLSVMIMFTYPATFFACRELLCPGGTTRETTTAWWLLERHSRQLILPLHFSVTFLLWSSTTILAILAPSLLDVVNLVGSATGTLIAFILPAVFSYKMRGYTHLAATLLLVGGPIGISGTYLSLVKLMGVHER